MAYNSDDEDEIAKLLERSNALMSGRAQQRIQQNMVQQQEESNKH